MARAHRLLAFARLYEPEGNAIVYTRRLTAPREVPSRRLPGVPTERCFEYSGAEDCEEPTSVGSVEALELYGRRLAQVVSYQVGRASNGVGAGPIYNEVRLVDLEGGVQRIAAQVSGESGRTWVGPSFANGRLGFYRSCLVEAASCQEDAGAFRYRITTGLLALARDLHCVRGIRRHGKRWRCRGRRA